MFNRREVERLQASYPKGTRIQLNAMSGEADMPDRLLGTVDFVDDIGQLHMKWDNGRSLALVPGQDLFTVISGSKLDQEQTVKPDAQLIGANGNIFNLLGIASRTLKAAGMSKQAGEMFERASACSGYEEALNIMGEYVNFTAAKEPGQSENQGQQFGLKME